MERTVKQKAKAMTKAANIISIGNNFSGSAFLHSWANTMTTKPISTPTEMIQSFQVWPDLCKAEPCILLEKFSLIFHLPQLLRLKRQRYRHTPSSRVKGCRPTRPVTGRDPMRAVANGSYQAI
jgi:hypothetical protein